MNTETSYQKGVDPVCGMQVDPHKTDLTAEYDGRTYFFCAEILAMRIYRFRP
jgi:YHS domain-containing protein